MQTVIASWQWIVVPFVIGQLLAPLLFVVIITAIDQARRGSPGKNLKAGKNDLPQKPLSASVATVKTN